MSIRWSNVVAPTRISQLRSFPLVPIFFGVTLLLGSTQLRTLSASAFSTMLSSLPGTKAMARSTIEVILQYIVGFGTWYGLSTIGEPPLNKLQLCGDEGSRLSNTAPNPGAQTKLSQDPMPAWLIYLFCALVAVRYILTFLVSSQSDRFFASRPEADGLVVICFPSDFHRGHGFIRGLVDGRGGSCRQTSSREKISCQFEAS
jgi:hypothetical protein